jgi:hypothetical protein
MMEAEINSETSVNFYQITRRNNPEDRHRHTRRRENLKSNSDICLEYKPHTNAGIGRKAFF